MGIVGEIRPRWSCMKKNRTASGRSSGNTTGASRGSSKHRPSHVRVGSKRWKVQWVSDISEEARHLPEYGFRGVRGGLSGLIDIPFKRILIRDGLSDYENQATLFHELIHVAAPNLSEYYVYRIERLLYPVLRRNGLRFKRS